MSQSTGSAGVKRREFLKVLGAASAVTTTIGCSQEKVEKLIPYLVSPDQTVLELQLVDRLGLLYDIFMAIGRLGHNVTHARISTEKGVAIDAIYVQDEHSQKITDREKLDELAAAVTEAAHLRLSSAKE